MTAIIQYATQEQIYKDYCEELSEAIRIEKELKVKIDELKKTVIEMADGERMEYGIKVAYINPKGTLDYKKIVEELELEDTLLEKYRKPGSGYWVARNY